MFRPVDISNLEQIAPKLYALSQHVLFEDIWQDTTLDIRSRCFVTLSVLMVLGRYSQMNWHIQNALKNRIDRSEIIALVTHLAFYIGLPNAVSALEHMSEEIWSCP